MFTTSSYKETIIMAKWANTLVLDALLDKAATATQMLVTSSQPADRASALTAALASVSVSSSDFTKSDSTSPVGRKTTIAQKANLSVTASGSATHVCLIDGTNLLYVTTTTSQPLTAGNTVTIPAWNISVSNAT
jgi:hypothetical protein